MSSPLSEALDLTRDMLAAAQDGNRSRFERLHQRRARLFKPGLYADSEAPRLLPQLDAAQKELAAILDDDYALDDMSELLRPISDDATELPSTPHDPRPSASATR
ncbi:MAG: hypothetical protein ACREPY_15270 [Rhodanobacteraceae bacterium]